MSDWLRRATSVGFLLAGLAMALPALSMRVADDAGGSGRRSRWVRRHWPRSP